MSSVLRLSHRSRIRNGINYSRDSSAVFRKDRDILISQQGPPISYYTLQEFEKETSNIGEIVSLNCIKVKQECYRSYKVKLGP
ncbi:hypothetical protein Tco_1482879, partial [Tanacetum coccineum]